MSVSELAVMQAVRMKGRAMPADVAIATGAEEPAVKTVLDGLVAQELAVEKSGRYRLSPEGRERLTALLEEERAGLDQARIAELYERFIGLNGPFKQLATDWQQKDGEPNDHSDEAYDAAVLARLAKDVHPGLQALLPELVAVAPRLAPYAARFENAVQKVEAGDSAWLLRPIIDSYHTVWFELHEDLIGLAGHTRADEAAAGRAA